MSETRKSLQTTAIVMREARSERDPVPFWQGLTVGIGLGASLALIAYSSKSEVAFILLFVAALGSGAYCVYLKNRERH